MGWACGMHRREEEWWETQDIDHPEDLDADGRKILKWILEIHLAQNKRLLWTR
jgi:hypothetical protein